MAHSARLLRAIRGRAAAGCTPSRSARAAAPSAATATASSTRPPSAASSTRRKFSCSTRAITTAPGSPIRSKSRRCRGRWRGRSASTRTSPRPWRWPMRVVTALERRYPAFDGLNLTWETLEGLVKHNGPLAKPDGTPLGHYRQHGIPETILDYSRQQDLQLWTFPSVEAQIAAFANDIAYDAHDIDDGLRAALCH